jgi:hypothetical protein
MTGSCSFCLFIDKGTLKAMPVHQQGWFGAAERIHETMLMMVSHVTLKNDTRVKGGKWFYIGLCKQE